MVFALGLLAKPMLVTLPLVFLLLDYWPLGRYTTRPATEHAMRRLVAEKLPLLMLVVVSCQKTLDAQRRGGALLSLDEAPAALRLANALIAYLHYGMKMLWPVDLAVFYPFPSQAGVAREAAFAGLVVAGVSILAVCWRRSRPYLIVGWLWYLGTLVPVIGLVQVGLQSMADRYTYIPLIGLFLVIVWGAADLVERWRWARLPGAATAAVTLGACAALSWVQVSRWRDSTRLWEHALTATPDNYQVHYSLGRAYRRTGDLGSSINHYRAAIALDPTRSEAHNNLGSVLARQGKLDEAVQEFSIALRLNPQNANSYANLGTAMSTCANWDQAVAFFRQAIALQPELAGHYFDLAYALQQRGDVAGARQQYLLGLRLDARWPQAANQTAWRLATDPDPHTRDGKLAVRRAQQACEATSFRDADLLDTLAAALAEVGQFAEARSVAQRALDAMPTGDHPKRALAVRHRLHLYESGQPFRGVVVAGPKWAETP
jgi:tetratricopeptide (TPR) repeat protein